VEKQFHISIEEDYPLLKFYNFWDEHNVNKYNELEKLSTSTDAKTMR